jgi:hypothetical protein
VSALTECTNLGIALSQAIGSFRFWPVYKSSTFQVLAVNEDCGLLADS